MHKNPFLCFHDERISEDGTTLQRSVTVWGIGTLLAVAFTMLLWLSPTYAQTKLGHIQGKLIDKKYEKPLVTHPVTLNMHQADTVETQETTTDESGNYRFGDLPLDESIHYTVSIAYEGTDYTEKDLVLSTWAPNLTVNFEIGAFADDRSKVQIKAHTFVIGPPPPDHAPDGALSVMEVLQVENKSDMPFQTEHDNQAVGLHLGIPAGYEAFQVHTQHELAINPKTQQVILKNPLPPGTLELGYAYILHVEGNDFDLSRFLNFETELAYIFVPDEINFKPQSKRFSLERREMIHNRNYTLYHNAPADSFSAGATVDFKLKIFNPAVNFEIGAFTYDKSKVQIKAHRFFIGPPPPDHAPDGALSVIEVLQVENKSDMPFQTKHDNQAVGLHLGIPAGYEAFQVHTQHELAVNPKTREVILKNPLPPGTLELGYAYILHVEGNDFDLSRSLNFETELAYIFVPDGINFKPQSKRFSLERREMIHNRNYTLYHNAPADSFSAGATVDFKLKIFNPEALQAKDLRQMVLIAVAAALAGGFLAAAIFKLRRAGNQRVSSTEGNGQNQNSTDVGWLRKLSDADIEHVRVARLEFIAYLDEMHEKQDISERVYNRLRREQTERLTELLAQRKARGLNQ